jgi:hypothetical protein
MEETIITYLKETRKAEQRKPCNSIVLTDINRAQNITLDFRNGQQEGYPLHGDFG